MGKKWTEKEIELLKKSTEYTYEERLLLFPNRSKSSIATKMSELKIYSKNIKFSEKSLLARRVKYKNTVSNNILNCHLDVNTPELSYLLGLLWGDGSLGNTKNEGRNKYVYLGINTEDFEDISYLFKNWHNSSRIRKNRTKGISEVKNYDVNFSSFLFKNGYADKSIKSPSLILKHIPDDLKHYFWRGYSDADGCFYVSKNKKTTQYALAGSYEQDWTDFEDLLKSLNIKYTIRRAYLKNSKYSAVRFCKKSHFIKFGEYIYQGKVFGLNRKYRKFTEVIPNVHEYLSI